MEIAAEPFGQKLIPAEFSFFPRERTVGDMIYPAHQTGGGGYESWPPIYIILSGKAFYYLISDRT